MLGALSERVSIGHHPDTDAGGDKGQHRISLKL